MYRETYALINTNNIKENIKTVINKYNNYKYYFGVVKAKCYGHGYSKKIIDAIIDGGCNYLVVALLEEALEIRKYNKKIPILCVEKIDIKYLDIAIKNKVTITINSYEYAKKLKKYKNLKVHIKVNTGMNRLGIDNENDLLKTYNLLKSKNIFIEGIYTHIYDAKSKKNTKKQFSIFKNMISKIKDIPIVHVSASEALINYKKEDYINGCRLGIIMYGYSFNKNLNLLNTFELHTKIMQINTLNKGSSLGYNGLYRAKDNELVGVLAIGYADGIIRKNMNRYVYIKDKKYKIIGNICMDMLFIKIDKNVSINDDVLIIKDNNHVKEIAKHLHTIPYEVISIISERVPRIYI